MHDSKDDKEFNATLRRLIKQKPKPHDEMKKPRKKHEGPDKKRG